MVNRNVINKLAVLMTAIVIYFLFSGVLTFLFDAFFASYEKGKLVLFAGLTDFITHPGFTIFGILTVAAWVWKSLYIDQVTSPDGRKTALIPLLIFEPIHIFLSRLLN